MSGKHPNRQGVKIPACFRFLGLCLASLIAIIFIIQRLNQKFKMKNCDYTHIEFGRKCKSNKKATKVARVKYNNAEQDALFLCDECAKTLTQEAHAKRWQLTIRECECSPSKTSI